MPESAIVVVIPLYNGARFIEEAVRSVLTQTLRPNEFLVVDDGSTDNGPAIVQLLAAEDSLITLVHKPNGGQSSARNFGVANSKSALIALLDQDDVWYPNHLAELVAPFRAGHYPPLGWVYSNLDLTDAVGRFIDIGYLDAVSALYGIEHPKRSLVRCIGQDLHILPSASLISRTAFDSAGGFDERLSGCEDDDLFLRLFRLGYANIYINKSLSQWRQHATNSGRSPRMVKSRMIYMQKLLDTFPDEPQTSQYYSRDVIMPRFLRHTINEYPYALRIEDTALIKATIDCLPAFKQISNSIVQKWTTHSLMFYSRAIIDGDVHPAQTVLQAMSWLKQYANRQHRMLLTIGTAVLSVRLFAVTAACLWRLARRFLRPKLGS